MTDHTWKWTRWPKHEHRMFMLRPMLWTEEPHLIPWPPWLGRALVCLLDLQLNTRGGSEHQTALHSDKELTLVSVGVWETLGGLAARAALSPRHASPPGWHRHLRAQGRCPHHGSLSCLEGVCVCVCVCVCIPCPTP